MVTVNKLLLTESQQSELSSIAQSRSLPAGYVFRAKLILMLAEGASFSSIKGSFRPPHRLSFAGSSDSWHPASPDSTPAILAFHSLDPAFWRTNSTSW